MPQLLYNYIKKQQNHRMLNMLRDACENFCATPQRFFYVFSISTLLNIIGDILLDINLSLGWLFFLFYIVFGISASVRFVQIGLGFFPEQKSLFIFSRQNFFRMAYVGVLELLLIAFGAVLGLVLFVFLGAILLDTFPFIASDASFYFFCVFCISVFLSIFSFINIYAVTNEPIGLLKAWRDSNSVRGPMFCVVFLIATLMFLLDIYWPKWPSGSFQFISAIFFKDILINFLGALILSVVIYFYKSVHTIKEKI